MKKFVTLFPKAGNVHLVKDVGQIPLFLFKLGLYDTALATKKNDSRYSYLRKEAKGLKIHWIEELGHIKCFDIGVLKYISKSARTIDILNIYHFTVDSIINGLIYKLLNRKGFLYMKLDDDLRQIKKHNTLLPTASRIKRKLVNPLINIFLDKCDLISVESREGEVLIKTICPKIAKKLVYCPGGIDEEQFKLVLPEGNIRKRRNEIVTVGRLSAEQKNIGLILNAATKINLKNWKILFIGPIDSNYSATIKDYFKINRKLRGKVMFTGEISDRKKLLGILSKSKIFCLPSNWESFGIVLVEALFQGNYLITTPTPAVNDITDNLKFGETFHYNDEEALSATLQEYIDGKKIALNVFEARKYIVNNFTWANIVRKLSRDIEQRDI